MNNINERAFKRQIGEEEMPWKAQEKGWINCRTKAGHSEGLLVRAWRPW